jgi:CheY-like chemotaxis protein
MDAEQGSGHDVLIVEDQADLRDSLADLLALEGYRVATAANGQEALTQLRTGSLPHMILLDLRMPVMDGAAFRREQQAAPAWALIPVVVISAEADLGVEATALNAAGQLTKPIDLPELLSLLERFSSGPPDNRAPLCSGMG